MHTSGVPCGQIPPAHFLSKFIQLPRKDGFVSCLYKKLQQSQNVAMGIVRVWNTDLKHLVQGINWERVWNNIPLTSSNYNYQLVNYKFIHRYYLSPRKCCQLRIITTPICALCTVHAVGTYFHMVWECPAVENFWREVIAIISNILKVHIPFLPHIVLLNDDTTLKLTRYQKILLFNGLTVAKKILAIRWKPPHSLNIQQWYCSFLDALSLEVSIARARNMSSEVINPLSEMIVQIRNSI